MTMKNRGSLILFPTLILIGYLVALAGSQGGATLGGIPVLILVVGLAFLIQWLVFIPAYLFQTEKFFDITGSITYITVMGAALYFTRYSIPLETGSVLVAALVMIWAIQIGTNHFRRLKKDGKKDS